MTSLDRPTTPYTLRDQVKAVSYVAASFAIFYGAINIYNSTKDGLVDSLTNEASAQVRGFDHLADGGPNAVPLQRNHNMARIALTDATYCHVQYDTYGSGFLGHILDNRARITGSGDCTIITP